MDFNFGVARTRATQQAVMFNRVAPTDRAIKLSEDLTEDRLITTFMVNNYSTAPASVFLGVTEGMHASMEIAPGACPVFVAFQEGRQLYELQILIMKIASQQATDLVKVPVIVWDMTQWYLQAAGDDPIEVAVTAFPLPYL